MVELAGRLKLIVSTVGSGSAVPQSVAAPPLARMVASRREHCALLVVSSLTVLTTIGAAPAAEGATAIAATTTTPINPLRMTPPAVVPLLPVLDREPYRPPRRRA